MCLRAWVQRHVEETGTPVALRASSMLMHLEAIRAGGRGVLPCYVGDGHPHRGAGRKAILTKHVLVKVTCPMTSTPTALPSGRPPKPAMTSLRSWTSWIL
jgi:hypothetical protein